MKYLLKQLKNELRVTQIANLHFFEFPQNFYTEPDIHPFHELIFVSSGKLNIESDNFSGILEKDHMLIHQPDEYHALKTIDGINPTVIIIGFICEGADLHEFAGTPTHLDDSEVKKLAEIIKEGRNVFAPPYDVPTYDMKKKKNMIYGAEQMLKNLMEYFLIMITRKNSTFTSDNNQLVEKVNVNEIVSYIDNNYKEKITLDELAFIFTTNRSTLCKVFKAKTGKTINEYTIDKKIMKAKEKIKNTDLTLTEIAEQLNFESIHYFTRLFKKSTGISPNEYRKYIKKIL